MTILWFRSGLTAVIVTLFCLTGKSQSAIPDILTTGSIREQTDYIEEKTRIYDNYRAIREDMFQKIKKNATDSVAAARTEIKALQSRISERDRTIDSLKSSYALTVEKLDQAIRTKNSIGLLGFEVNKNIYNSVLWIVIVLLIVALTAGFLAFKRNSAVTRSTRQKWEDLKKEFEAYRKSSREAREKMSMAHFNELRKLRNS